jgi:deferrochelatase/peroxidase EfeB
MATDLDNKKPIIPEERETMLRHLQGNILKGHGRDYSVHIFLRFKDSPSEVIAARLGLRDKTSLSL